MIRSLRITTLVENRAPQGPLQGEAGLSLWVEADGRRVLFDTGLGKALPGNAEALDIDLSDAEAVVISHGHNDHTGALGHVLERAPQVPYFMHPVALEPKFNCRDRAKPRPNGMTAECARALRSGKHKLVETHGPTEIVPGLWATGEVPRENDFEKVKLPFYLDAEARRVDPLIDDQAAWAETPRGVVAILGCSHSGVVNTLHHVARLAGVERIHAAIGGTHLLDASPERLERTAEAVEGLDVEVLAFAHCTGAKSLEFFRRRFPDRFADCMTGTQLVFE